MYLKKSNSHQVWSQYINTVWDWHFATISGKKWDAFHEKHYNRWLFENIFTGCKVIIQINIFYSVNSDFLAQRCSKIDFGLYKSYWNTGSELEGFKSQFIEQYQKVHYRIPLRCSSIFYTSPSMANSLFPKTLHDSIDNSLTGEIFLH